MIFIQAIVYFALSISIAHFLGKSRQIGFGWSLFFCIFLTLIGGFIITMLSRKYYDSNPSPSKIKLVIGWLIGIVFGLASILLVFLLVKDFSFFYKASSFRKLMVLNQVNIMIGLSGLGFYLIGLAKGKKYNNSLPLKN